MAIEMPGPESLAPGALRDFVQALHQLYDDAGQPPSRQISDVIRLVLPSRAFEAVSHETVSALLRGRPVPAWGKTRAVVAGLCHLSVQSRAFRDEEAPFNRLWAAARSGTPAPPEEPRRPPVAPADRPSLAVNRPLPRTLPTPSAAPSLPAPIGLPTRATDGIERSGLLDEMDAILTTHPGVPLVLHGMIGSGKSQLALGYARSRGGRYTTIAWIPARSLAEAQAAMAALAAPLAVRPGPSAAETADAVRGRLAAVPGDFLLIFDGAGDENIRRLIPPVGGHVIVTSRDPGWAQDGTSNGLTVPAYTAEEARKFVAGRGLADPDAVVARVGRLPLALAEEVTGGRPTGYPGTLKGEVHAALARLRAADELAAEIFELFAVLAPVPVPPALLKRGLAGESPPPISAALQQEVRRLQALLEVTGRGLARLHNDTGSIEVDPAIRAALWQCLDLTAAQRARDDVHALLAAADPGFPDDVPDQVRSGEAHAAIAVHVAAAELIESRFGPAREAVYHLIRYHHLRGENGVAVELARAAVARWREETLMGSLNPLVLGVTLQWANALRALGEYDQARDLTAAGLSQLRCDPIFGDGHLYTLEMSDGHSADLRIAGEYTLALELAEEIHQGHVSREGQASGRAAMSRHHLAVSHRLLGDFAAAEHNDRQTLEQHRDQRGPGDWRTLLSTNALGEDLYGLGRYAEALEVLSTCDDQAVASDRGLMLCVRTVALAQRELGDAGTAADQLRDHVDACVRQYGEQHEHTLAAQVSLAATLRQCGAVGEARALAEAALDVYRRTLGPRNPLSLAAQLNLAAILRAGGDYGRARHLDGVAAVELRAAFPTWHPFRVAAMVGLASDYALTSRSTTAAPISREAYQISSRHRGPEHPQSLVAGANLVIDLRATGLGGEADRLRATIRPAVERIFGDQHPFLGRIDAGLRLEGPVETPST
ncbi:FxSxx-COOH system tetratricopeptide repeat protein [Actinoplanes sp. NPDC026670]|uniref:FxSxx-COOH system tetratricopeptide repeat protein n=1 Tax=Actinoplanes sp. NPDC026670 TaxID=3154700 RepID=UPI0033DCD67E